MKQLYADIALAFPSLGTFQYAIPLAMQSKTQIGMRVFVSVRNRRMVGYVTGFSENKVVEEPKEIEGVIDESPILNPEFLDLTRWMSEYYLCSWGQAIEAVLPAPFKKGKLYMKSRAPKHFTTPDLVNPADLDLTSYQDIAFKEVAKKIHNKENANFLLHGITGSGKTEVYMHLIREVLARSRGSIVLVPEISLTPQTVERFYSRFGDCLAVIHSRLTQAKRVEEWHRIRKGEAKVIVGARSAIFSPVKDLGLIVIDEEHDTSYKQEETPRYETRRVGIERAKLENAVLLLGSATPSLETYCATKSGEITRLDLPERIEKRPLPEVEVVDMRRQPPLKTMRIFSNLLEQGIKESLLKKEQCMLLLNRRGFSTYLHCPSCGYVMTCKNCRISLAYHFDKGAFFCHICQHRQAPERACPACRKSNLHFFGLGTQQVEKEALRLFPGARIARMDADSTAKKDSHEKILRAFKKEEVDILIGTQMIAKGHDFPNVSLIGVISADTALHIPDFRAAERTFSLLTQVAGRAGRGDIPGKVLVQSYVPHHYSIQSAKDHNYLEFYNQEIVLREELLMPPFKHLARVVVSGANEREVLRQITALTKLLESMLESKKIKILGPAPCAVSKEKGMFRWNIYLKGDKAEELGHWIRLCLQSFKKQSVQLLVDVDPQ